VTYVIGLIALCVAGATLALLVDLGLLAACLAVSGAALSVVLWLLAKRDARERCVRPRDSMLAGIRQADVFDWLP
jgi:hypothetical protein